MCQLMCYVSEVVLKGLRDPAPALHGLRCGIPHFQIFLTYTQRVTKPQDLAVVASC